MPKQRWMIDWHIEGTVEIEADDAAEAQKIFDTRFCSPKFVDPFRDGEIYNDPPYQDRGDRNG